MKIGIDIDGVITDIVSYEMETTSKFRYDKKMMDIPIKLEEYETKTMCNFTDKEDNEYWNYYMFEPYFKNGKAREYASEVIKKIKDMGHEIYIITARGNSYTSAKEDDVLCWLEKENIVYDKLFKVKEENASELKKQVIIDEKVDIMIEDYNNNIKALDGICDVIVFDNIYNRDLKNYKRAYGWYDILYMIENYNK